MTWHETVAEWHKRLPDDVRLATQNACLYSEAAEVLELYDGDVAKAEAFICFTAANAGDIRKMVGVIRRFRQHG